MSIRDAARTAWLDTQGSSESEARLVLMALLNDQILVDSLTALLVDFENESTRWFFEDSEGLILRVSKRPSDEDWLIHLVEEESPGVWLDKGRVETLLDLWLLLPPEEGAAVTAWTAGEVVIAGDIRSYEGINYECIKGHTTKIGREPPNDASVWEVA